MTDEIFDDLKGIEGPRNVQIRNPALIERLVDAGDKIVDKHFKQMPDQDALDEVKRMDGFYSKIYNEVMLAASNINFDEQDIATFVRAKASHDLIGKQAQVLGVYSGCLAQLLTERNALQGKRTTIHLDGEGSAFDYLFYFARVLDTVILENFKGDEILAHVGNFGGRADTLVCNGIKGYSCLLSVGSYNGKVNKAIAIDVEGSGTLMSSGSDRGYVSQVFGISLKGDASLSSCATTYGFVEQVIGVGVTDGSDNLSAICTLDDAAGAVNQILAVDINGSGTLNNTGNKKSRINEVIYDGIVGSDIMNLNLMDSGICREVIDREQVRATHSPFQAERIETTIALVRSLKDKPYQEVIKIADQIYALRPVFSWGYSRS